MFRQYKNIGRFAVLAALCGLTGSLAARAQEESSVLVEKNAEAAAEAPELMPPANQPTLPPPQRATADDSASQPARPAAKRPFMRPADPRDPGRGKLTAAEEPMPAPAGSIVNHPPLVTDVVIDTRPTPPIKYDTDGDARRMYRRSGQIDVIMVTENPADGCFYEIPLCIPACCTGEPTISGGRGIFGRGVVEYCWPCGFRAIVKFRHILGDVRVDYEGD
jgi:hypothetical protein